VKFCRLAKQDKQPRDDRLFLSVYVPLIISHKSLFCNRFANMYIKLRYRSNLGASGCDTISI